MLGRIPRRELVIEAIAMTSIYQSMDAPFGAVETQLDKTRAAKSCCFGLTDLCVSKCATYICAFQSVGRVSEL